MFSSTSATPILVTGCQRSGTTLLNLVLDSHPRIASIDEDRFSVPSLYVYLASDSAVPFVCFKLPRYAHMLPFIKMLPGCRVVWSLRDPVDTVWSMVSLRMSGGNLTLPWAAHPNGGWFEITNAYWALGAEQKRMLSGHMAEFKVLNERLMRLAGTPDALQDLPRRDAVFMAALCWTIKNEFPFLYEENGIDYHVVRYDDLVQQPRIRIAELLTYIGVEWRDEVMRHHDLHQGTSVGNTRNTRAIDKASMGTGARNLTDEELTLVQAVCGPTAKKWDYDLATPQ